MKLISGWFLYLIQQEGETYDIKLQTGNTRTLTIFLVALRTIFFVLKLIS